MADANKTEKPTPRRQKRAREQGQVARSRDLSAGLAFLAVVLCIGWSATRFPGEWQEFLKRMLSEAGTGELAAAPLLSWSATLLLGLAAPVLISAWLAAAAGSVSQGGLVFAPAALAPRLSRLNPATRLQQLFSLPALSRVLRAILPASVIVYLACTIVVDDAFLGPRMQRMNAPGLAALTLGHCFELAWKAGLVLLAWAGIDFWLERQHLSGELRMSRQELLDDYKETEGNPQIKNRIRRLRRQTYRRRMLEDAKRASVVITNPNEFAIALEYRPAMSAPTVVAKGRNLLAQQIKQVARWHGIPMVENPALAHALYRAVDVGQYIPPKLYRAVAAILAAIYRAEHRAQEAQRR